MLYIFLRKVINQSTRCHKLFIWTLQLPNLLGYQTGEYSYICITLCTLVSYVRVCVYSFFRVCFLSQLEKAKVIQTSLFVSGLSTLLQSLFGTRLPSVVVGSYTCVIPTTSIVLSRRYNAILVPHEVGSRCLFCFLKT